MNVFLVDELYLKPSMEIIKSASGLKPTQSAEQLTKAVQKNQYEIESSF